MSANDSFAPPDAGARYAERRMVRRYSMSATAEVMEPIARVRVTARATYLSVNGCFVEGPTPLPINTVVQVRIRQADPHETFETWGRVASIRAGSETESSGIGVAFFQAEPDQEQILVNWIEHLQSAELASK